MGDRDRLERLIGIAGMLMLSGVASQSVRPSPMIEFTTNPDATTEAEQRGEGENGRIDVSGSTGFSRDPDYNGKGLQLQ